MSKQEFQHKYESEADCGATFLMEKAGFDSSEAPMAIKQSVYDRAADPVDSEELYKTTVLAEPTHGSFLERIQNTKRCSKKAKKAAAEEAAQASFSE